MEFINREVTVTTQLGKKYQGVLASVAPDSSNFVLRNVRIVMPPSSEAYDVLLFHTALCTNMTLVHQVIDPLQNIMRTNDSVGDSAVLYCYKTDQPGYQKAQGIIQGMFASTTKKGQQFNNNQRQNSNNSNKAYSNKRRANQQTQTPQPHKNQNKNQDNNNKNSGQFNNNLNNNKNNKNKDQKSQQQSPSKTVRFQDQVNVQPRRPQRLPQVPAKFNVDRQDNRKHNINRRNDQRLAQRRNNGPRRDHRNLQIPRNGVLVPKIDAATGQAVKLEFFDDNFDFEEALKMFQMLSTDGVGETDKENGQLPKDFYDKQSCFFDKISSDTTRDVEAKRRDIATEAKRNMQTFGERTYKGYVRSHRRTFSRRPGPQRRRFVAPRQVGTQDKADEEQKTMDPSESKEVDVSSPTVEDSSPAEVRASSPIAIPVSTC